jgi:four helix bundle protein
MMGESFKDLIVWPRAIQLCLSVYQHTSFFPRTEQFGLTSQMRRAAVSVASNLAEGYGHSSRGEYVLFLGHVRGSNCEVQTQLVLAEALSYGSSQALRESAALAEEVSRMLVAMMKRLKP